MSNVKYPISKIKNKKISSLRGGSISDRRGNLGLMRLLGFLPVCRQSIRNDIVRFFTVVPVVVGIFFLSFSQSAHAEISRTINFQGKLVDSTGLTVADGTAYQLIFSLYNVSSGGSAIWTETENNVTVSGGIFQVTLGATTSLSGIDFNNPNLYLGITISKNGSGAATGESEMTPRIQFTATPYAFNADKLDGVVATQSATGYTLTGGYQNLKTLTLSDNTTLNTNAITFGGGESVNLTANKSVAFADSFTTAGAGPATLTAAADGFTLLDGLTGQSPRTLTVTGADITIGSTIKPTSSGALIVQSNGSNSLTLDTGGAAAVSIGGSSNAVNIGNNSFANNTAVTITTGGSGIITLGSNTGIGNVLVQPNAGGKAALIINDQGLGDLATASSSGTTRWVIGRYGNVTIGDNGILTGNAQLVVNQTNAQGANDIFTASTSGTTKFTIHNDGSLQLIGGLTSDIDTRTAANLKIGAATQNGLTIGRSGAATTINGSSLTFGAATGVSGALTITSNSSSALTVGANGSTNPVLQVDASTGSVATGLKVLGAATGGTTAVSVTDSGSNANLSIDAKGSGTITIGGVSTGNIIIGGSSNGLTFSTSTGPTYAGNSRPQKTIVLSPEFAGAIITASGSATTTGSMTSDASSSATLAANGTLWKTFYSWTSPTASPLQDYTVAVRVTLPQDFSAWQSTALTIDYNTLSTSSSNNALDVYIYNPSATNPTAPVYFSTNNVSANWDGWSTLSIASAPLNDGVNPDWNTAGQSAVIYLKMKAMNNFHTLVGDIKLNYLAKF